MGADLITAIDAVCLACWHVEPKCSECPVRELADAIREDAEDGDEG